MRAVLFDFDFTLADSSPGVIECFAHGFARVGLPPADPEAVRRTIGLTLPEALRRLHGVEDAALARDFSDAFRERAEHVMVASTRWLDRALEAVATCREVGLATAICSTKRRSHIEGVLARDDLHALFDAVIGSDDVATAKPAPDALHAALTRLGVGTDRALYVGDHPVDAEAAARAGVTFVAVLSGPSDRAEFASHPVRAFLRSIGELPGHFEAGRSAPR
ncbi:MAG: HAD-IA family hydrolase [Myxococcota bacterium]|nr:HAD-IA family hydrolase [Myxococcota bacterium]